MLRGRTPRVKEPVPVLILRPASPRSGEWLIEVQRDLYKIMAELAFTDELRPAGYVLGTDINTAWRFRSRRTVTRKVHACS